MDRTYQAVGLRPRLSATADVVLRRRLWQVISLLQCLELPLFPCKPVLTPKGLWVQVFDEADRPPAAAQHNHSRLAGRRE